MKLIIKVISLALLMSIANTEHILHKSYLGNVLDKSKDQVNAFLDLDDLRQDCKHDDIFVFFLNSEQCYVCLFDKDKCHFPSKALNGHCKYLRVTSFMNSRNECIGCITTVENTHCQKVTSSLAPPGYTMATSEDIAQGYVTRTIVPISTNWLVIGGSDINTTVIN